ncbi:hypothetical protein JCM10213_006100 [Rhodosporidiobolus nylandii]
MLSLPSSRSPSRARANFGQGVDADEGGVNPLFSLSERVSAGEVDPSRVVIQRNGVTVREGPPPTAGVWGQVKARKERERVLGNGRGGHGHGFFHTHHHANGGARHEEDKQAGDELDRKGKTLRLDGSPAAGQAEEVEDFRDEPEEQDRSEALKLRLREKRADLQERLEEGGWLSPDDEDEPREVLEPRLAAMLDRRDGAGEQTNGASTSSVYSTAASETSGPASTSESLALSSSALSSSYASVADTPIPPPSSSFPSATSPSSSPPRASLPPIQPHTAPLASSSRLSPLLETSPVLPTAAALPPRTSSLMTPSLTAPVPSSAVSSSPSRPRSRSSLRTNPSQPDFRPSFGLAPSHPAAAPPPPELSPTGTTYLAPQPPSPHVGMIPPSMRRSNTTGSSPTSSPSTSPAAGPPHPAGVLPYITSSHLAPPPSSDRRRYSTTASPAGRTRGSSLSAAAAAASQAQRSNSFSPASLSRPAHVHPPHHSYLHPHAHHPQNPQQADDVESSIALQAEAIRRQRAEKREAQEKEAARLEREAAREKERESAASSSLPSPPPGAQEKDRLGLGVGLPQSLPGPGALLKRRTTRMGSGSSALTAPDGTPQRSASGASTASPMPASSPADEPSATPATESGRRSRAGGREEDEDPRAGGGVLVGNLIGQDHANYVLMYNMLTGIRIGVSRCQAKLKRPLTDADYTARHKFSFDIVGNELTPSVKYDFKFKDYAPWVFRELREYFYLDPSDYLVSLTAKYILSELGSPGKSGSFFYFSRDYRFIIKTIRHSEHKFLRSILKDYHEYVKKNPHTLISRFYGLHRVKLPHGKKIHFVIMNNLFPPHRDIHETYDLKGSAIGRLYPEDKAAQNPHAVLKDLNWVTRHRQLALGPEKKALFEEQLRRDTELLQRLGIMDYSLLTGIHNGVRGNSEGLREGQLSVFQPDTVRVSRKPTQIKRDADASALRKAVERSDPQALGGKHELPEKDTSERRLFLFYQDEGGMRATGDNNEDLGVIYYLGIIDILTPYTLVKRLEHFIKGCQHDKHMISAVPPKEYGDRFLAFIKSIIRGNDESTRPRMFERKKEERKKRDEVPPANVSEDDEKAQERRERDEAARREQEEGRKGKEKAQ